MIQVHIHDERNAIQTMTEVIKENSTLAAHSFNHLLISYCSWLWETKYNSHIQRFNTTVIQIWRGSHVAAKNNTI